MSKQTLAIVGVLVLTFGTGMGVGFFLGNDPARAVATNALHGQSSGFFSSAAAEDREQANSLLSARIRELESEIADPKRDQRVALADRLAFFKKYHDHINLEPFSQNLKVTPEMAALLALTPQEKQAVEQHLAEVKAELEKIQDADTVLSKQTDNSVSYDISADKQGDVLKAKLQGLLTQDMGADRTEVFMGGNSYNYNSQLAGFLEGKKQIEISWTQQNNHPVYTVRQQFYNASGAAAGSSSMSGGGMLQPEYQKYLPDGMKP